MSLNDENKPKLWPRRDFYWLISMFTLSGIFIVSLVIWNKEAAIRTLDVSGILAAIILALVAIIYTFSDSGDQKRIVTELHSNVQQLEHTVREYSTAANDIRNGLEAVVSGLDKLDKIVHLSETVEYLNNSIGDLQESFSNLVLDAPEHDGKRVLDTHSVEELQRKVQQAVKSTSSRSDSLTSNKIDFFVEFHITGEWNEGVAFNIKATLERHIFRMSSGLVGVINVSHDRASNTHICGVHIETNKPINLAELANHLRANKSSEFTFHKLWFENPES